MRKALLTGALLAVCTLAVPRGSSAGNISLHPFVCNLVQDASPWSGVTGATYGSGTFTNNSGITRRAHCPVTLQDTDNDFQVSGTSTVTSCILKTISSGGTQNVVFGSRSVNTWTFTTTLDTLYAAEIECVLPQGAGLYHLVNY